MRTLRRLSETRGAGDIFRDFVTMYACSLSNVMDKRNRGRREKLYLSAIRKYEKSERALFPELAARTVMALEENPGQDFLGKIFMDLNLGDAARGQFFTPRNVCDMMAKMALGDGLAERAREHGYISVCDPCCGAGAMFIAALGEARRQLGKAGMSFQRHVLLVGQEIDFATALMCYVQISLLGGAGYVKVGNALTEPIEKGDRTCRHWFTPFYFLERWGEKTSENMRNVAQSHGTPRNVMETCAKL